MTQPGRPPLHNSKLNFIFVVDEFRAGSVVLVHASSLGAASSLGPSHNLSAKNSSVSLAALPAPLVAPATTEGRGGRGCGRLKAKA